MLDRIMNQAFQRFHEHYILVMMLATRVVGSIGGSLVMYYVNLTTALPPVMRRHFIVLGLAMVSIAVAATIPLALWDTRRLRRVLRMLRTGEEIDSFSAEKAGREAVTFARQHQLHEAIMVPFLSVVPMCIYLRCAFGASPNVLLQVTIAGFLAIAAVSLITFFANERWMMPVTQHLLDRGIAIDFDRLPASQLQRRMNVCFLLTIVVTALMIGALANQRAADIIKSPDQQQQAVLSLRTHTTFITLAAMVVGAMLSRLLSRSIANRVTLLLEAMKRVQEGQLSQRMKPTGNDEIDKLARQFNAMVEQLERHDHTIRDLNVNLESKVKLRTKQLSKNRRSLKRSLSKLQEYDRLKTEFFSNISHELRTPLTMILAPVDRILDKTRDSISPQASEMLEVVRLNGRRLLDLINRLLDFSKLEAGHMQLSARKIDLNQLIRELVAAARPLAEQRGLRVMADFDPELPLLEADEEKLDIIISNLLSNAMKFTPEGGTVRVETLFAEDRVWVVVSDTGIGIDEADYAKVFERFVQSDGSSARAFSGTGLGLALVKELVELHGGQIHLKSQIGRGSRFWFDLPLVSTGAPTSEPARPVTMQSRASRFAELQTVSVHPQRSDSATRRSSSEPAATVLVVDDTPEMRLLIADILQDDYNVLCACDGAEGLTIAANEHPDLIISDVMMPHVDGHEFCRRIKSDPVTAQIPFVMLTAKADLDMKIDGLNCGADDYLTKPFDEKELKARARSLLKLRRLNRDLDKRNRDLAAANGELVAMQGQLVQAEKMSSLGQLVAGLAHEINNSINAVYNGIKPLCSNTKKLESLVNPAAAGNCDLTESSDKPEVEKLFQKIYSLANVIEHGATRTVRIVSDLKTFSHPGTDRYEDFDLHGALDICLNLLFSQMKDRITVQREYGQVATVHGPSGQLNQVFMNILNNAQQAIDGAGEIFISTHQESAGIVCVSIRDSGCGISEETKKKIFDPFFTTKAPGVGTGLGLSVSYGIISRLGGSIECNSTPGQGTEFKVRFPRVSLQKQGPPEEVAKMVGAI